MNLHRFSFLFLFSRDALAIRLYCLRMLEQFLPYQTVVDELREFDDYTLELYHVGLIDVEKELLSFF